MIAEEAALGKSMGEAPDIAHSFRQLDQRSAPLQTSTCAEPQLHALRSAHLHRVPTYRVPVKHSFTRPALPGPPLSHNLVLEGLVTFHPGLLWKWEGERYKGLHASPCVSSKSVFQQGYSRD